MTDYEKHVERRARAIREAECRLSVGELTPYDNLTSEVEKERLHYLARATFAADREAGYVLVPEKATKEMAEANSNCRWPLDGLNAAIAAGAVKEESPRRPKESFGRPNVPKGWKPK